MKINGLTAEEEIRILDKFEIGTPSSFTVVNVQKGSIQLYIRAAPNVFKSHKFFKSSIRAVIQRVLEVGNVDTRIEGTLYIQVTVDRGESMGKWSSQLIVKRLHQYLTINIYVKVEIILKY